jgi:hypothetical protein
LVPEMLGSFSAALTGDRQVKISLNRISADSTRGWLDGTPKQPLIFRDGDNDIFSP